MNDFFIAPHGANDSTPSLVQIMHLDGVDESMRDAARQFSDAGFAVYIPDLYASLEAPDPRKLMTPGINEDINRAITLLRERFPKTTIGIAGFCMGGRIAMVRSSGYSRLFAAAAIWYGFADEIDPKAVDIPVVASYGGNDEHIPAEKVETFFSNVPVEHDLKIYPGACHGFFHKESAYEPKAAADSFARTAVFLHRYLG